ncbi:hypothetical protein AOLI_G00124450 [Acnodon oligacanthus]
MAHGALTIFRAYAIITYNQSEVDEAPKPYVGVKAEIPKVPSVFNHHFAPLPGMASGGSGAEGHNVFPPSFP